LKTQINKDVSRAQDYFERAGSQHTLSLV